jgi:lysophospholipase L1-like esterase
MSLLTLLAGAQTYMERVRATPGLIGFWPIWEPSGTVAFDLSGNGRNGVLTSVTLGQPGIGDGRTAGAFDPVHGRCNIYSASLAGSFNADEGSFVVFAKLAADALTDGAERAIAIFQADGSNNVYLRKTTIANQLGWGHKAGGTAVSRYWATLFPSGWVCYGMTWSQSNNRMRAFVQGSQIEAESTGLGIWAGALAATTTNVGAVTADSYCWSGDIQYAQLYDAELTPAEMRALAWRYHVPSAVMFGDSTISTAASDAAHSWPNLVAVSRGYTIFFKKGIGSTTLQNTVQNTVVTIGGATENNGRDTYAARILPYNPEYVYILYGLNDLRLNDAAFSAALYQNDLGEIVDGLVAGGITASHIVIGSPPHIPEASYANNAPWDGGSLVKHAQYVAAAAEVASTKGTRYVDVYQRMATNGGDALTGVDGIHPNDAGHQVIADAFLSVL